ncbi:zinc-binding dehydrogenase [Streptomyces sp. NBC_01613]|uniref:zinc-binding dehydrogenase n=1 Tax=Streptomyces sp. NBC_01613 TaxID=2975896 RepID=UPI0038660A7E
MRQFHRQHGEGERLGRHNAAHPDGIDAVLGLITLPGGDIDALAGLLKPGGRFVSTNHAADPDAPAAREVHGVNLVNDPRRAELEALADLTAAGKLRITIDAEIPLMDAPGPWPGPAPGTSAARRSSGPDASEGPGRRPEREQARAARRIRFYGGNSTLMAGAEAGST